MANVKIGSKVKVVDKKSKWHEKSGIVKRLIWQSLLTGDKEISSAICALDGVKEGLELKIDQIETVKEMEN